MTSAAGQARTHALQPEISPISSSASPILVRRKCACTEGDDESTVRRSPLGHELGEMIVSSPIAQYLSTSGPSGSQLDPTLRARFERGFGRSLENVRVVHDERAARAADSLGARALTLGNTIWFGRGAYRPQSAAGQRLLAHEVAHTLQQGPTAGPIRREMRVGASDDPAEGAADRAADAVMRGAPAALAPSGGGVIRRQVDATVGGPTAEPSARVCLIQLHHDEQNSLAAAQDIQRRFCANLVFLDQPRTMRWVKVDFNLPAPPAPSGSGRPAPAPTAASTLIDPNRIFTDAAILDGVPFSATADAARGITPAPIRHPSSAQIAIILPHIQTYRNSLLTRIDACSDNRRLPIVAFHNNSGGPLIDNWQRPAVTTTRAGAIVAPAPPARSEASSTETSASRLPRTASGAVARNPSMLADLVAAGDPAVVGTPTAAQLDPNNFLVVTDAADFAALRGRFNVVLQRVDDPHATTPATGSPRSTDYDDGSASVFFRGARYLNLESLDKRPSAAATARNTQLGEGVMAHLGVPLRPSPGAACPPPPSSTTQPATSSPTSPTSTPTTAPSSPSTTPTSAPAALSLSSMTRCAARLVTFARQRDLDAQRDCWRAQIDRLSEPDVVAWIVGAATPPAAVTAEATEQRASMLAALHSDDSTIDTAGDAIPSEVRSSAAQRTIWLRKFNFTGSPFDAITTDATTGLAPGAPTGTTPTTVDPACAALAGHEGEQWDPSRANHLACWRTLSDDVKQIEILQASSAPGISRHHWGTEVDLFSVEPVEWRRASGGPARPGLAPGRFVDASLWLQAHAAEYGFVQSYSAGRTGGRFPMQEEWHWSYYPVSQALLGRARAIDPTLTTGATSTTPSALETAVLDTWRIPATARTPARDDPRFSFIRAHWRDFMTNVSTTNPLPP